MDLLTEIGLKCGTDKATYHEYTGCYNKVFEPIRLDVKSILEIGVWKGQSIRMWHEYFPNAIIYGIDSDLGSKTYLEGLDNRVRFCHCRQEDFRTPEVYDIILDDGSHFMADQQKTFINLLNNWKRYYIIEDLQTSRLKEYGFNGSNSTIVFLKTFQEYNKKFNVDIISLIHADGHESLTSIITRKE